MVVAILVGAFFLNIVIQAIGLTQQLSQLITAYQLTPVQVLSAVIVLYLVLGTFMEELSMMISTIPITTPLMVQAGYDPVWYGILIVLLIQNRDDIAALRHQPVRHPRHPRPRRNLPTSRRARRRRDLVAADDHSDLYLSRDRDGAAAHLRCELRASPPPHSSSGIGEEGGESPLTPSAQVTPRSLTPCQRRASQAPSGSTQGAQSYSLDDDRSRPARRQLGALEDGRVDPAMRSAEIGAARRSRVASPSGLHHVLGHARNSRRPWLTTWIETSSTGSSGPAR